jgi:hypothetical protein
VVGLVVKKKCLPLDAEAEVVAVLEGARVLPSQSATLSSARHQLTIPAAGVTQFV